MRRGLAWLTCDISDACCGGGAAAVGALAARPARGCVARVGWPDFAEPPGWLPRRQGCEARVAQIPQRVPHTRPLFPPGALPALDRPDFFHFYFILLFILIEIIGLTLVRERGQPGQTGSSCRGRPGRLSSPHRARTDEFCPYTAPSPCHLRRGPRTSRVGWGSDFPREVLQGPSPKGRCPSP